MELAWDVRRTTLHSSGKLMNLRRFYHRRGSEHVDSKITGAARKNSVEGGRWGEHAATRLRGRGVTLENEIPVSSEFPMSDSEQTVSN
ncbi:hypothetical protein F2P81_006311 [Scophthalmus maximus]|uniref:Uncharacterized protein n=1 Tax=Scophthalmus maximus TaxID=52904 RepID=A0A6A4T2W5_SCOMX|nr:hypothetical protein F2P81_006311 [Scophthalmus maximus]